MCQISEKRPLNVVISPVVVDDEDAVGGRVEGGGQERERLAQLVLGARLHRGVVRRDDETLDRRVVEQVHDAHLEGHGLVPVVALQADAHDDGMGRGRAVGGRRERAGELGAVSRIHDVEQRTLLQHARGRSRAAG